jgi:hypothetical protein
MSFGRLLTLALLMTLGMLVAAAGVAVAYFVTTDSSNPAQALADTLPSGATPGTPTPTPSANSSAVSVTFAQASTVTGHAAIPASNYVLQRYPAAGGAASAVTATCSGTGTVTCTTTAIPDGQWQFTDTPTYGTNWVGTESARSGTVTVDTTPPTVTATTIGQAAGAFVNGFVKKSTSYYVYANVTDGALGSGVATVTANVATITTGSTAVALTTSGGPFTSPGGTSFTFRSGALTSNPTADSTVAFTVNAKDVAGNTSAYSNNGSATFDTTAPTTSLSLGNQTLGNSYLSGAKVYYRGTAAGTFTISNALSDAGSGPYSSSFPALGGISTGWTHTAGTVSTPTGGPFVSSSFSWTAGTATAPTVAIVGTDHVGNANTATTLTFTNDVTGPTGGALTVNGTAGTAGGATSPATSNPGFAIGTRTNYSADGGSGLASSILTVQSETFSANTCGAAGSGGPFTTPTVVTGTTQPGGIVGGYCYAYTLTGTDNVANTSILKVTVPVIGAASQLVFTQQPSSSTGGTVLATQPKVTIQDAGGNTVNTDTSAVTLAIGTNPGGGTLSGCSGVTTAGVATFSGCKIDRAGSGYTLTATDATDGLTTPSAPSGAFNITAGAATQLLVIPSTYTPNAGSPFTVTLTAADAGGNTATSYTNGIHTVSWSSASTSPAGNAPSYPVTAVNFTGGVSTTTLTATLYSAGANTLRASATYVGTATITVAPLSGTRLAWTSASMSAGTLGGTCSLTCTYTAVGTAGGTFKSLISLTDAYGNPVANPGGAFTVTVAASGGTFTGSATVTIAAGGTTSSSGGDGTTAGEITFVTQSGPSWGPDTLSMTNTGGVAAGAAASFSK